MTLSSISCRNPIEYPGLRGSKKVYLFLCWSLALPLCLSLAYNIAYTAEMRLPDALLIVIAKAIPSFDALYQSSLSFPSEEISARLSSVAFATLSLCLVGGSLLTIWAMKLKIFYVTNRHYIYQQDEIKERLALHKSKQAVPILLIGGITALSLPFVLRDFLIRETFAAYLLCLYGGIFMLALLAQIVCAVALLNHQEERGDNVVSDT